MRIPGILFVLSLSATGLCAASPYFEWSPLARQAYEKVIQLRFDEAHSMMRFMIAARHPPSARSQRQLHGTTNRAPRSPTRSNEQLEFAMRNIALWLVGLPIPVIVLLHLTGVI